MGPDLGQVDACAELTLCLCVREISSICSLWTALCAPVPFKVWISSVLCKMCMSIQAVKCHRIQKCGKDSPRHTAPGVRRGHQPGQRARA
eukprot:1156221-Pelagomonas_calceolata.AAC.2